MPKNKGKGGKTKRRGKNGNVDLVKRELIFKEDGQEYGQVVRILGNCRVECNCFDGSTRLCHIRGNFKKKIWINRDDIVLLGLRDFQDDKADIIHKYNDDEARQLKAHGELPDKFKLNDTSAIDNDDDDDDDIVNFDSNTNVEVDDL